MTRHMALNVAAIAALAINSTIMEVGESMGITTPEDRSEYMLAVAGFLCAVMGNASNRSDYRAAIAAYEREASAGLSPNMSPAQGPLTKDMPS